jgi:hypothetical protein
MTINLDDYANVGSEAAKPVTSITPSAAPTNIQGWDPVAIGIAAVAVGALALSAGSSVPGVLQRGEVVEQRASRLAAAGLVSLEGDNLEKAIASAEPLISSGSLHKQVAQLTSQDLAAIGWEEIINDRKLPPGYYLTRQSVVVKELQGVGSASKQAVIGHSSTLIGPDRAAMRLAEYQANIAKAQAKRGAL